ncbi:MAG: ABC transporter substrate-binding protein [Caulobacteraceae bacterium]
MPLQAGRGEARGFAGLAIFVVASVALLVAFAPSRRQALAPGGLPLSAPLPDAVPPGTTLTVGDPVTQWVFEHNGWERRLPFKIRWARITGGPAVTEAFHARALDVGMGANMPPIHAVWVGMPVKIIGFRQRRDPLQHPSYVLGLAPGANVSRLTDLRGKRIAFSPSQVQSEVVMQTLKAEGLTAADVKLVELPSNIGGDVYTSSLAGHAVDVAPLGTGIVSERYLRKFAGQGARTLPHPPFRDDAIAVYTPVEVLQNPAKAAALKVFVRYWGMAQAWEQTHPEALAEGYYVQHEGLSLADAKLILSAEGDIDIPRDWRGAIAYQQASIDLMAPQTGHPRFDAALLFDPRFEALAGEAAAASRSAELRPHPTLHPDQAGRS